MSSAHYISSSCHNKTSYRKKTIMTGMEYASTVGMNPEPFIRHFKEQVEGKKPSIHLVPTSRSFGGSQRRQGLVLLQQGRGLGKNQNVTRIQTIDPVQSTTNQAAAMLNHSIKETDGVVPAQTRRRPQTRRKGGKSPATGGRKTRKVKTGAAEKARRGPRSGGVVSQRTRRAKDIFSNAPQVENVVQ